MKHILFALFAVLVIALSVGTVEAADRQWCYQEDADTSESCGAVGDGGYGNLYVPSPNWYDGVYGNYIDLDFGDYLYVNYTIPTDLYQNPGWIKQGIFQADYERDTACGRYDTRNASLNAYSCMDWTLDNNTVALRMWTSGGDNPIYFDCYNGTEYITWFSGACNAVAGYGDEFAEEAMFWNISDISSTDIYAYAWDEDNSYAAINGLCVEASNSSWSAYNCSTTDELYFNSSYYNMSYGVYNFSAYSIGVGDNSSFEYIDETRNNINFSDGMVVSFVAEQVKVTTAIYDEITNALVTEDFTTIVIGENFTNEQSGTGNFSTQISLPENYTIRYQSDSDNYTERDYYITYDGEQSYTLNLYALAASEATDFIMTVEDTSGDPVQGATVKLLRYYSSCNCYNVVEMAKTDAVGEAYLIADAYDGHYKLAVDYNGVNYFLSTDPSNFIPSSGLITRTITINLGDAYFESFRASSDFSTSLVYNNDTKTLSYTWSDPSGLVTQGCLYAEYVDGVHYTQVTPNCQSGSTGSVLLTLNNSQNSFKYYTQLETSTTYSDYVTHTGVIELLEPALLTDIRFGGFIGGLLTVFLALVFSFSAIASLLSVGASVVILSFLGVFSIGTAFVTGFIAIILGLAMYGMRS